MTAEIIVLPAQAEFIESTATHTAYIGGFGSGKSVAGTLKTAMFILSNPGTNAAYYLPTYQLIKDIAFPKFKQFFDETGYQYTLHETDKEFRIKGFGKIVMRSLDNPDLIIGYEVGYSCIDEVDVLPFAKMKIAFAKIIARNRSKTANGHNITDMVGTPEGFGFAYNYFVKDQKPNRRLIKVKTKDNPYLPQNYIDTLTETYTNEQLEAYLNGEFVNLTSGTVYRNFDRKKNNASIELQPGEVIHIGMDFNITNMNAVCHVIRDKKFYAFAELSGLYDTSEMIRAINDHYPGRSIVVYPDASGKNRNTSGYSDMQLLQQARFSLRAPNANPFVRDRVNSMNLVFLDNKGNRKYFVDVLNCPRYTEALEQLTYKNNEPDKDSGHDHITDAAGYFVYTATKLSFTI